MIQSSYLPWKGTFDIIHDAELFIFHDCAQYTKQDWRNRNQIYVGGRKTWITVPVRKPGRTAKVSSVSVDGSRPWRERQWRLLESGYREAPYFRPVMDRLEPYLGPGAPEATSLSALNQALCQEVCAWLGVDTPLMDSAGLDLSGSKTDRLLEALAKVGATSYVSGPTARSYIEPEKFREAGIELLFKDYGGYPPYPQFSPAFDHQVSILDLLFQAEPRAPDLIWGWRKA
jgi:hypothetical protein